MYLFNKRKVIFTNRIIKTMAFNKTLQRVITCCSLFQMFPILLIIILSIIQTILAAPGNPIINYPQHLDYQSPFNPYATRRDQLHQGSPMLQFQNNKSPAQILSPSSSINNMPQQQTPQISQLQAQQQQNQQVSGYMKAANDALLDLRQQMITRSLKFDEHFRQLLSNSKVSLHNLFADTYGMMYETNTEIFTSMFESLEQYYAGGNIKLTKSMESFFERLYQKIFQVYHANKAFPNSYLECLSEQITHLKPFKDVPEKLIDGIRHGFVAARTFNQALSSGITVIKNIVSLGQTTQCINLINEKLVKNTIITSNIIRIPCTDFCEQVVQRCIGTEKLAQLNEKWKGYVTTLNELAVKLSNRYNIETIIAPLDIQISEAIMNFQDNAQNISMHVFQVCGGDNSNNQQHLSPLRSPLNKRLGRRAAAMPSSIHASSIRGARNGHEKHTFDSLSLGVQLRAAGKNGKILTPQDLTPNEVKPPPVIDEIKTYMSSTKSFWSNLPNTVCSSNYTLALNSSISARKPPKCYSEPLANSDINSDIRYRLEISQQLNHLDAARRNIESALRGEETEISGSAIDQKQPTIVPPFVPNPEKSPLATTTTTTTAATLESFTDEEEEEEEEENPDEAGEIGSGEDAIPDSNEDDLSTEFEESTTEAQDDSETGDGTEVQTSSPPFDISTPTNVNPEIPDNGIGSALPPDSQQNLTFSSSQISNKLVISIESRLLLSMSVALLIVRYFQTNLYAVPVLV